uniref:Rho GTPase activating protein 4a n=1 Tax=Electrophorus electricus TaxID=8005 RepID=A0AAY5EPB8_ELEEL
MKCYVQRMNFRSPYILTPPPPEVRNQLAEQLRVVDSHLEQKSQVLQELSDYLRRRGEIESEYARSLDKLVDKFTSKSRKKESSSQSAVHCWHMLLSQTRQESKDHSALSDSCSTALPQDLSRCLEHVQRLAKKSKDICTQLQDGLLKVTVELQTTLKTYSQYHTEYLSAEVKLKEAAKQEEKQKQSAARKIERLIEKRQCKVQEIQLKCNKARNDYLLNLEAANASMNKYFLHDVSSLFDYSDAGFHQSLSQVLRLYMSRRSQSHHNLGSGLQQLAGALSGLDQNHDRDTLMQMHEATFCLPLRFQYQPHEGDQVCEVSADCEMKSELETRFQQLQTRLSLVTSENEELSNMVQVAHTAMLDCINEDVFGSTPEHITSQSPESTNEVSNNKFNQAKRRTNLQEVENSYFMKVKDYLLTGSLASKLQARHDLLKVRSRKSVRQKKSQLSAQTSLSPFFGDLLSYIQVHPLSGQPQNGPACALSLHHEGIFRVPGSQLEVNRLRDTFERGDDPLADETCDMDSVAGVLKLYFRGMENPLFPKDSFDQLMACGQTEDEMEKVAELKRVILSYPPPLIVVMRYLFAFLHHVSQYSDENMMQPYNLAVCFGPSLIRGPEDADAVALQQINAIVKTIITQHESIFPSQSELDGPVYETCMTLEQEDIEVAGEEGELESDASPHKEVKEELEGIALFDYTARSTAELSFKQGERVLLHSRASFDWWRGEVNGTKGLIPDKYISMPSAAGGQDHRDRERSSSGSQTVEPRVSSEKSGVSASHVHAGKITLQIPTGQHMRQATSPGALRKPIGFFFSFLQDVCHQMNSVFKELLSRQQSGEQPEVSHSSSLPTETLSSSLPQNSQGRRGSAERKRRF